MDTKILDEVLLPLADQFEADKPNRWCTFRPGEIQEYEKVRECMAEMVAEGSLISKSGGFQRSEAGYTKYVHRIRALRTLNSKGVKL